MRRICAWFYRILPITGSTADDRLYLLTEEEARAIRSRERIAVWISGMVGALGVVLLYVPYYLFPAWFPDSEIQVQGFSLTMPVAFLAYSTLLVAVELLILSLLNVWCAHEIAVATGFLNHGNKQQTDRKSLLLDIGLEKKNRQVLRYGIDPFIGLNRTALMAMNLVFLLKATLTNLFFRFLIQRVMGRYLIRAVQDFAGVPIFAFWNAYGTRIVLQESRVIIFGQNLIEELVHRLQSKECDGIIDPALLPETMQYIAFSKRDFHQNHYLLTRNLFERYAIRERRGPWREDEYVRMLLALEPRQRSVHVLLVVLGMMLDGRISRLERTRMQQLRRHGLLPYDDASILDLTRDFLYGKGVERLLAAHLPAPQRGAAS